MKGKLSYIHLFGYSTKDKQGYAMVERSLFRYGRPKVAFQNPGEYLFVSDAEVHSESLNDVVKSLIMAFFESDLAQDSIVQ